MKFFKTTISNTVRKKKIKHLTINAKTNAFRFFLGEKKRAKEALSDKRR